MKYSLLFIIAIAVFFTSCHKEATLPPITNNGANVLGCKVDGKIIIASGSAGSFGRVNGVRFYPPTTYGLIQIYAHGDNPKFEMFISFIYLDTPGTYQIISTNRLGATYDNFATGSVPSGESEFNTDSTHTGFIKITQFSDQQISGTFAFDAMNDGGKVVHLTEGRFDIGAH